MPNDTPDDARAKRAAYMREWRAKRKAAGLPSEQRSPEGIAKRKANLATYTRQYREAKRAADPSWRPIKVERPAEVHRAGEAVRRAIQAGKLVRPDTCEECGTSGVPIEAAHYDYERENWLRVRWLCRFCHRRWDADEPKSCRP